IQATSAGAPTAKTQTLTLAVVVPAPDFAIAVTVGQTAVLAGKTVVWSGTLTALHGYNHSVTLACATSGKPGTCTFSPPSLVPTAGGAAFTVTLGNSMAGTFDFTIQGSDGTITHTTSIVHLTVNTDVNVPPTLTDTSVQPGQTATTTMSLTPIGGSTF